MSTFTSSLAPAVLPSYDFSPISQIVDFGGGQGILTAEILKANPTMKGILFNRSPVVEEISHPIIKWLDLTVLLMTGDHERAETKY